MLFYSTFNSGNHIILQILIQTKKSKILVQTKSASVPQIKRIHCKSLKAQVCEIKRIKEITQNKKSAEST